MRRVTPMIHVPDVAATIAWYESVGFSVLGTGEDGGETVWAELAFGDGRIMLGSGGKPSDEPRREVDLYVHTENVDRLFAGLSKIVRVQEPPHDMFYGMREFIVRDNNGFWLTFGEPLSGRHGQS